MKELYVNIRQLLQSLFAHVALYAGQPFHEDTERAYPLPAAFIALERTGEYEEAGGRQLLYEIKIYVEGRAWDENQTLELLELTESAAELLRDALRAEIVNISIDERGFVNPVNVITLKRNMFERLC